jgi:hypothetical protein
VFGTSLGDEVEKELEAVLGPRHDTEDGEGRGMASRLPSHISAFGDGSGDLRMGVDMLVGIETVTAADGGLGAVQGQNEGKGRGNFTLHDSWSCRIPASSCLSACCRQEVEEKQVLGSLLISNS